MKFNLPTRKEMNEEKMQKLVTILAEYKGGDYVVKGELFDSIFSDLSAVNQEKWIAYLKKEIELEKAN